MNGINADWIYVVPSIKSISVDDHSSVLLLSQDYHIIYHPIILWIFFHYTAFLLINADHNMTKSDWESKFYWLVTRPSPSILFWLFNKITWFISPFHLRNISRYVAFLLNKMLITMTPICKLRTRTWSWIFNSSQIQSFTQVLPSYF